MNMKGFGITEAKKENKNWSFVAWKTKRWQNQVELMMFTFPVSNSSDRFSRSELPDLEIESTDHNAVLAILLTSTYTVKCD